MDYVGRRVKKEFQGYGIFGGTVRSFDSSRGYYRIEYEDGDSEELEMSDMASLLVRDEVDGDEAVEGQGNKRRRLGDSAESGNCCSSSGSGSNKNEFDLNAAVGCGGLDLNVNFNLNEGLDLNCGVNEGLDLNKGVNVDDDGGGGCGVGANANSSVEVKVEKSRGEIIDLNLDATENENESENLNGNSKEDGCLSERKGHCFDLNLGFEEEGKGLEEEVKGFLGGDREVQIKECSCEGAQINAPKEEEGNCGNEVLEGAQYENVENNGCIGVLENELTESNLVEVELKGPLDINDGGSNMIESNIDVVPVGTPKKRRGRKRKVVPDMDTNSPTETVLRRSTRRVRKAALLDHDNISSTVGVPDAVNDLSSSPAVSAVTEEKVAEVVGREVSEERIVLPPKLELPPSSGSLNLEGMPVLDIFFVYSFLRSFSTLLFLSPFELEDFLACLSCNSPSVLFESIHVSLLHTLRKHLESLSEESSQSASNCLRSLNWDLLDIITWPVFVAEYLLMHCSGLKPGFDIGHLKLFESDYYNQSPSVKIEILRCLCDDVIEVESIKSELNKRSLATEPSIDFDRIIKPETTKKRKAVVDVTGSSCVTQEDNDILDWNSDECCLCKMDGTLICCDGCPAAFHSRCVGVVSNDLPEGDWYCPECVIGKDRPWTKVGKSIRGADLLGIDPYGQLFYSCCGYMLVLENCHSETSFKYYSRNDLPVIIEAMKSSQIVYCAIINAILKQWDLPSEVDGAKEEMGSQIFVAVGQERPIPATFTQLSTHSETHLKDAILNKGRAEDKSFVSVNIGEVSGLVTVKSDIVDHAVNMENQILSSEGSAEVFEAVTATRNFERAGMNLRSRRSKSETPGKVVRDSSLITTSLEEKVTDSAKHNCLASATKPRILSQGNCGISYTNYYCFARTASSVAEVLTRKSSDKNSEAALKSVDEIISEQMLAISDKFMEFCWPNVPNMNADTRKESCGWCFSCRVPEDERECLVSMYCNSPALEKYTSDMLGIRSRKNKRSHLVDVLCYLLCTEDRLQGLLLGPWLNSHYSNFWRKSAARVTGIAAVKSMLLKLESNLHPQALSADWTKHVDSAATVGSSVHVIRSSARGSSRNGIGRKRARCPDPDSNTSSSSASGLGLLWWRGGRLSRQIFNWKVLPHSLASKAARQAGGMKIPGILYPDGSEFAKRSKNVAWRAAVESCRSVEQLALQVRELDANIKWDDIENTNLSLKVEKDSKKPVRSFKKVIVRRKCSEGTIVKYLLDFGKRRFIPDIVVRHGSKVEDSSSERKKYWLEESHLPLHLLKAFELKRIARRSSKISAKLKVRRRLMKHPFKKKGFSYLFSKAERSENYHCGHCNKDVLIREAVSCQYCKGFFHKRHVRKSAGAVTAECTYTCHKCQDQKNVKNDAKKERLETKKRRKASKQLMPLQSKIRKNAGKDKQLRQIAKNKNGPVVIPLRRSPRKAKCVSLQNKKIRAHKRGKQNKATTGASKKRLKSTWQKKRMQRHPIYWLNGLHLSKKPNDERFLLFKSKNLLVLSGDSTAMVDKPRCILCCEQEFSPMLNYIACELCGDWFHGDALDLKMEQVGRLIGFKCHNCLKRNPPCCPHLGATKTEGAKLVGLDYNEGIDSISKETNGPSSEAFLEENIQLYEESKKLSLASDLDEKQPLGTTFGPNQMLKSDAENGQLSPNSVQKAAVPEFSNEDSGHPDQSMASKEDDSWQKDAIIFEKPHGESTTPVGIESLSCKSSEDVSEKDLTSLMPNHMKNGLVNQQPFCHAVVDKAFDSIDYHPM
ncbi:DDT domain-containing protein PTM [Coffea eugenioides]|uniref:DDT domain-containing protein PTM n=1 Tax=Coffea eugenioides TaxID=49369 RepID=UPI000F61313A|nr:DDT domain-containing protein PTM [Coffea eugenioides]